MERKVGNVNQAAVRLATPHWGMGEGEDKGRKRGNAHRTVLYNVTGAW